MATTIVVSVFIHLRYCSEEHDPRQSSRQSPSFSSSRPADICTDFYRLQTYWTTPIIAVVLVAAFLAHLPTSWRERIRTTLPNNKYFQSWRDYSQSSNLKSSGGSHSRALSTLSRVASVNTFKNLSKNLLYSLDNSCYSLRAALQAITRKECFARSDYIERLSINDVALLFRYGCRVRSMNCQGKEEKRRFLAEQSQIVRAVITAMDMAVQVSRGGLQEGRRESSSPSQQQQHPQRQQQAPDDMGDMDALYFVAATRIFAEWRALRLVPKGYQRYAVALSLAYRDVLQNLEKMERGVHDYLKYHQSVVKQNNNSNTQTPKTSTTSASENGDIPSPTLRQLLVFESETKVHKNLPHLADKSSASGLLWTKRQLHYQTATFQNTLEVPVYYPTPREAAKAAYRIVYNDYHGWAIQKIFAHGFGGSPPLDALWATMDPPKDMPGTSSISNGTRKVDSGRNHSGISREKMLRLQHGKDKRKSRPPSFDDPPERTLSDVTDGSLVRSGGSDRSDYSNQEEEDNRFLLALEKIGKGVAEKWEDMLRLFNCGGGEEKKKATDNLILSSESHFNLNQLAMNSGSVHEFLQQRQLQHEQSEDDDAVTAVTASTQSTLSESRYDDHDDGMAGPVAAVPRRPLTDPIEQSKRDTEDFVREVSPMIADLGKLLDEFNMDDPTRV